MTIEQLAVQLYTVRDFCKNAADLAATAKRIRSIGYRAVQVSGLGPIPRAEIRQIMADEGLTICATHEPSETILDNTDVAVANVQALGCKLTAYPFPQGIDFGNPGSLTALINKLNLAGARFRAAGLTLGYHNHEIEFYKVDEVPVLEHIFSRCDPRNLASELDTYWVQYGGGNCVDWCRRLKGRLPFIHLKDYAMTLERKPTYCEIGSGTLPFPEIVAEAEASGCRWFIVEQDTCPGDPFASLSKSYEYASSHLVE